ncbi:MAG: DUF839 domain-containing protein [Paracoccaceae bacterium]|jgi:uncharacterized protein
MRLSLAAILSTTMLTVPAFAADIHRIVTVPLGAEVTGVAVHKSGDIFLNIQHPNESNKGISLATVGIITGLDLDSALALPTGTDKEKVMVASGEYQILGQEGVNGLGVIADKDGKVMFTSSDPDFNGFIAIGDDNKAGYLFTNWEATPGGISRMYIEKSNDGRWISGDVEMLDLSVVGGTWINCAGTVSPWNTPISSEELYWDNTADWFNPETEDYDGVERYTAYNGGNSNPYRVGWNLEIKNPIDNPTPHKLTTLGRFSHENIAIMNDGKTVYQSDDGTNTVFFKFIADQSGNLDSGTLYAAHVATNADESLEIDWVELAHATKSNVDEWIAEYDAGGYISDEEIADWAAGKAKDNRVAFLESRKAAAAKGASNEFRKMEVVRADPKGENLYMAMSEVAKGMSDDKGDIKVTENACGIVYQMALDASFNVDTMTPFVVGSPEGKVCSTESISNPDNLWPLGNGVVLIGEDTSKHENNMLWVAK